VFEPCRQSAFARHLGNKKPRHGERTSFAPFFESQQNGDFARPPPSFGEFVEVVLCRLRDVGLPRGNRCDLKTGVLHRPCERSALIDLASARKVIRHIEHMTAKIFAPHAINFCGHAPVLDLDRPAFAR
jgi:hypothetical protein